VITESIITTVNPDGSPHIAPMGVIWQEGKPVLAPFRPSSTLSNLENRRTAVINLTDDARIFAGGVTGRRDWPTVPADRINGVRLDCALTHLEIEIEQEIADEVRPRFVCRIVHEAAHAPFRGFNRAQAAVVEGAILVSRLHMLPWDKIEREMAYLTIAVSKTAGPREQEAWGWIVERIESHRTGLPA
jgi:hypothetical protein